MLGERIAKLRKNKGLSQYDLAEKLEFSRGKLANYEQGSRQPDFATLQIIADFFEVTTDYLLGRTDTLENITSQEYDPLAEINKLIEEYKIEQFGFFDIEKWKKFSPEDVEDIRKHFEFMSHKAAERNKKK